MTSRYKSILRLLSYFAVPSLFIIFALRSFDVNQVLSAVRSTTIWLYVTGLLIFPIFLYCRYRIWKVLLVQLAPNTEVGQLYDLYLLSYALRSFFPLGVADIFRSVSLGQMDYPLSLAIVSVVIEKILSFAAVVLIGVACAFVLAQQVDLINELGSVLQFADVSQLFTFGRATVIGAFLLGTVLVLGTYVVIRLDKNSFISRWITQISASLMKVLRALQNVDYRVLIVLFFCYILTVLLQYIAYYLFSLSLGYTISFGMLITIVGIMGLAVNLPLFPISLGGIGVRDVVIIALFALLSYSAEDALAFSLIIFTSIFVTSLAFTPIWFRQKYSFTQFFELFRTRLASG